MDMNPMHIGLMLLCFHWAVRVRVVEHLIIGVCLQMGI